jgi:hypothetical protein
MEVILDGKSIFAKESNRRLVPDQFDLLLPLQKGINNLMLKITRVSDDWGFTFRLKDCEVRSRKNRYKIVSY